MRPDCLMCAMKHVAQSIVLMGEVHKGYPLHRWLACGHLAEAEDELVRMEKYRSLANMIRDERKSIMEDENFELMGIIEMLNTMLGGNDEEDIGN